LAAGALPRLPDEEELAPMEVKQGRRRLWSRRRHRRPETKMRNSGEAPAVVSEGWIVQRENASELSMARRVVVTRAERLRKSWVEADGGLFRGRRQAGSPRHYGDWARAISQKALKEAGLM